MMPTSGMGGPYVQPGMQRFPMMQHGMMMVPPSGQMMQQQPRMFPVQQMGPIRMRPGFAPPPYTQQMAENYRQRVPMQGQRNRNLSAEEMKKHEDLQRKEKQFLAQKQKLQQFGKTHGHVDPDKLIESMFGKTEKVKPKTEQKPKVEEFSDDSFGDFMSGPGTSDASQEGNQNSQDSASPNQYSSDGTQETKTEKKDLMSMMMECSDLTAPNKAKTFHKPALKEIHRTHHTHHSTHTFHQSQQARQWTAQEEEDLSALFTVQAQPSTVEQPSGQQGHLLTGPQVNTDPVKFELPHWCCDDSKVPDLYKQVYEAATVDDKILTERLYPILILSGLPKETLGQIWSLANRTTPGQLIKEELYLILALVAFAQNNFKTLTPDLLNKCPQPPIPFLGQAQPQGPPTQQPARPPAGPVPQQSSSFAAVPPGTAMSSAVPPMSPGVQSYTVPPSGTAVGFGQQVGQTGKPMATELAADDDFADFQAAPASLPAAAESTPPKPAGKKKQEIEYLYEVPKPAEAEKLAGPMSPEMMYSNVRNYFGSDDSSVSASPQRQLLTGPSTPNSFEDDFDDFKSADSKPSDSSQFTSSEQSENEDFKVFESYLDDFERKKAEQQESPLHRPVSKSSIPIPRTADATPAAAIPAVKNLWSKPVTTTTEIPTLPDPTANKNVPGKVADGIGLTVGAETTKGVVDLQLGSSPSKSSESDFADFQQAPVIEARQEISSGVKSSKSDASLIGEEDKYAALRSLDFGTEATLESPTILSGEGKVSKGEEEENWADFQGVEGDITTSTTTQHGNTNNKDKILGLFASSSAQQSEPDWADFQSGSAPVTDSTPAFVQSDSDWSAFNSAAPSVPGESDWSNFSSATVNKPISSLEATQNISDINTTGTEQDDWAEFQGPTLAADSQSSNITDTQGLVSVKKENLQKGEILGLFKVRETSELPADLKLFNAPKVSDIPPAVGPVFDVSSDQSFKPEMKTTKISVSSLDEDPFRVPPPMDDGHDDDDFGEYNRGYDVEDYATPQQHPIENKKYAFHGMGIVASRTTKLSEEKKLDQNIYADIMALDQEEQKTANEYNVTLQDKLAPAISEDSQSVSSLELPFTKTRLQNLQEQDDQSISSNEFVNYEARKTGTPTNMESKSVDSLDLIKGEYTEEQGSSGESPERELGPDKQQVSIKLAEANMQSVTHSSGPMPVLGDRYSSILEDVPGSDKHAYEWQRCLDNCYKMIKDANNIFNSISSSSVCNEVIRSEQGSEYVQGIVEIYRVVCKITAAMAYAALSTEKLKQVIKDIDLAWNNLTAFLVGGNLMPDDNSLSFKNAVLKSDDSLSQMKACGVCLLNVDVPCKNFNKDEDCSKLTYGRRQYHASCANFWVNCVDSLLPALKLPELL